MVYLFNLLMVPLYYWILRLMSNRQKANELFMWIVALHAILFRALANPNNYVDAPNYFRAYRIVSGWSLKHTVLDMNVYTNWGRGYLLYNWALSRLTDDPKMLYIVASVIAVGGVMIYYKKTLHTVLTPILFYLSYQMMYLLGFEAIRQHMAIPFLLFSLYYIERTKISLCFAITAMLLHPSCVVFFPFYFVHKLSKSMSYSTVAILSLSLFLAGRFFIAAILSFFPRYEPYLRMNPKNNIVPMLLVLFMILLLYEANVFSKNVRQSDRNLLLFLLYGFGLTVFCLGMPGAGRLSLPVVYVVPTAIGILYKYGGRNRDEYHLCVIGLALLVITGLYLAVDNGHTILLHYSLL